MSKLDSMNEEQLKDLVEVLISEISTLRSKNSGKKKPIKRVKVPKKQASLASSASSVTLIVHPMVVINGTMYHGECTVPSDTASMLRVAMQNHKKNQERITDGTDHGTKTLAVL